MPKVLPAIFSYEDMKRRFAQDNPDDPYTRRKDLETGLYALDNWLIRVNDEDKTISTVGWKEHPSHTTVGGMYATAEGRQIGGNNRALQDAREPQLNQSKPLVAAFGHRDGDNARWIATAKKNGWAFPDSENWEQMKQLLPESVVNEWNSAYPNGNWAIRNIRGKGEFAKCVYLDDPTPSWFNLLKYLPDNTWDDFELGEPAPDLGTRDRFKDKNIKSKGKAEYKAFVSQQYLRQVSDRIPNAGTSLMQGWLEKLTEMNLKKGKYWFFGTNVKQDNTYVMIDVIKQGEPYTPNADKKLNLEGFETAIIFTGVSKEMVGKVKRGQGIPKGRKFLDIHGKYGVRGLKRGRRLPKEPKNIFPTFEKSWKDILKFKADFSYEKQKGWVNQNGEGGTLTRIDKNKNVAIIMTPNYIKTYEGKRADYDRSGKPQRNINHPFIDRVLEDRLLSLPPSNMSYWCYTNDIPSRHDLVIFDVLEGSNSKIKQLKARVNRGYRQLYVGDLKYRKSKNRIEQIGKVVVLHHIDDGDKYPVDNVIGPDKEPLLNLFYDGIKPGHEPKEEILEDSTDDLLSQTEPFNLEEAQIQLDRFQINLSMNKGHQKAIYENKITREHPEEEVKKLMELMEPYFKGELD
jgi:hypothetical protein|tara:strand:- start:242 stop:2125 length:1884 start_codon:yes stop_codon:yes gene_type:complete